jgi:methyltransferase-like protein 6
MLAGDEMASALAYSTMIAGMRANVAKRQDMVRRGLWKTGRAKPKLKAPKTHMRKQEIACRKNNGREGMSKQERISFVATLGEDQSKICELLAADDKLVESEWREKYEVEAMKYWDHFYKQRSDNFYKDRHYLREEFAELMPPEVVADPKKWIAPAKGASEDSTDAVAAEAAEASGPKLNLLEVGCAVGNAVFPLLRANPNLFIYAADLSPIAIQLLKKNAEYKAIRCNAFSCDITLDDQPEPLSMPLHEVIPEGELDFVTMVFILSAISPASMPAVLARLRRLLKPGGMILFRDYGRHDLAQLRFMPGQKLEDNFYVRGEGTLAFFFELGQLQSLFESAGFKTLECKEVTREIVNRKKDITMHRRWVQAKFERIE